ncbi:MAG TPA: AAA family ATPase [Dehalococcoidales bacterium]|nr:AAA family ATPase [Dehalococcoidales bacterium]
MSELPEVVQALLNPQIYPDKATRVDLIQSQMSFIFLTGKYAYKVKKGVNLGYLDYSTLDKRHYFCKQEVELNRRLSPEAYLGVIPITQNKGEFTLSGKGQPVEYAVKMLQLPHESMLNVLLERGRATSEMLEKVAAKMAAFHARAATRPDISKFGRMEAVKVNTDENFSQTDKYFGATITAAQFHRIKDYTNQFLHRNEALFNHRADEGRVRDCHGDLHSQHICFNESLSIYDCIEFNDRFRYCDVASEIAFLAMDLDHFGRADLARSFVEDYIRLSGDKQIEEILKFFKTYRAYVRGKVSSFKYVDPYVSEKEKNQIREMARAYFDLAQIYTRNTPLLLMTVGLVGSGKTTVANHLARRLGLTVLSSDIIRKKLASVPPTEHRFDEMNSGIYSAEFSRKTYARLFAEAGEILRRGEPVILDATFIRAEDRAGAIKLAAESGAELRVVECRLDENNIKERLTQRLKGSSVSDGRWEIYEPQKKIFDPVVEFPPSSHFVVDTAQPLFDQLSRVPESL